MKATFFYEVRNYASKFLNFTLKCICIIFEKRIKFSFRETSCAGNCLTFQSTINLLSKSMFPTEHVTFVILFSFLYDNREYA